MLTISAERYIFNCIKYIWCGVMKNHPWGVKVPKQQVIHTASSPLERPCFCWDRSWPVSDIKAKLAESAPEDWPMLAAWIMREARFEDMWVFLRPAEIVLAPLDLNNFRRFVDELRKEMAQVSSPLKSAEKIWPHKY